MSQNCPNILGEKDVIKFKIAFDLNLLSFYVVQEFC